MSTSKKPMNAGRELMGMALFAVFSFPFVLAVLALMRPTPADATGTAALAAQLVGAFGSWPTLLLSGGFAAVGATLLLVGKDVEIDVGRHLCGVLFSAIGLGVCLGVVSPALGGQFGANTGGVLATSIATWAGFAVGMAVLFSAVWLSWLREANGFSGISKQDPTISDALSEKDADGVSQAEAKALVPDPDTVAYMEQVWQSAPKAEAQPQPIPPSPYPEDVRVRGDVPEGAQALISEDDSPLSQSTHEADSGEWDDSVSEDGAELGSDTDLAAAEPGGSGESEGVAQEGEHGGIDEHVGESSDTPPPATNELEPEQVPAEDAVPAPGPSVSWEQPDLFEEPEAEETEEEEPVALEDEYEEDEEEEDEEDLPEDETAELGEEDEEEEGEYEEEEEDETEGEEAAEYEEEDEEYEEDEEAAEYEEDEEEEEAAEYEEEDEEAAELEEEGDEPEAVLTPTPPPAAKKAKLDPAELLHEAGALFLQEGRVAVSLLQRGFSLDFDEACAVLDDLQQEGLIGPYKGGQKRDILLTSEEWDAQTASR